MMPNISRGKWKASTIPPQPGMYIGSTGQRGPPPPRSTRSWTPSGNHSKPSPAAPPASSSPSIPTTQSLWSTSTAIHQDNEQATSPAATIVLSMLAPSSSAAHYQGLRGPPQPSAVSVVNALSEWLDSKSPTGTIGTSAPSAGGFRSTRVGQKGEARQGRTDRHHRVPFMPQSGHCSRRWSTTSAVSASACATASSPKACACELNDKRADGRGVRVPVRRR